MSDHDRPPPPDDYDADVGTGRPSIDQIKSLPNYQINWAAVRDVMRDLKKEFQKLRRITGRCLPLVSSDEHKRIVRDLAEHIDKKMEACSSMGA